MLEKLSNYIEHEKFYKDVVEDGSDVIFLIDFDYNILYNNPSLHHTAGYTSLVGQNFLEYLHPTIKRNVVEAFEVSKSHPYNSNIEFKFLCANDTYKYLEFNSINLKFKDGIEGLILDCRDISERKKDQEELIQAQKTKEQFLANMSHEIRTPINGIVGMVNLLMESAKTPEQSKYLNAIKHSADNLKVIINDILDFSAIESGKLSFEKIGFDLIYQVQSVIESLIIQAQEKGLDIELEGSSSKKKIVLLGDPVRLNQILINLINNAIKFTHVGKITIDISCTELLNHMVNVTFHVTDTGIGIQKEKINSIFDTFKQADDSITRKFGGTGLGLTISKQLVELQDGKISVTSEPGKGTTFTFVLPYEKGTNKDLVSIDTSDEHDKNAANKIYSLAGMRVLLVEDNDINRMYAANVLKKWHCEYDEAENGEIALAKIRKLDYDIILMDIHMPVLDGIETSRSIRSNLPKPKSEIPIVAFTANALKGDRDKYLEAGINSYISKPFMPDELYKILSKYYHPKEKKNSSIITSITDLTYLRKMSNNDESFVIEMVNSFVDKTPEIINEMNSAKKNNDWEAVGSLAHKLKPNLAFMGIDSLKNLVVKIETNGKNSSEVENLPDQVNELTKSVIEVIILLFFFSFG
jgi:PAS domain S-box-containing protein